jgi:putative spermidine/putrescine transport system permease protein
MSDFIIRKAQFRRPKRHGAFVFFLCFGVIPLGAGLVYALLYSLGVIGYLNTGFTLQNWSNALSSKTLWSSLGLSLGISLLVSLVSFLGALRLIMVFQGDLNSRSFRFMLHLPLAIPPLVAAFISFQWLGSSGMLARMAVKLGWIQTSEQFPALVNDPYYIGVILTLLLLSFPFIFLYVLDQYKRARLHDFSHLAATLGANPAQIRRKVVQPVLMYRVLPMMVLYTVFLFGSYEVPLLLGRQSPAMISVLISQKFSKYNLEDVPLAYVGALVYAMLLLGLIFLFWRWHFRRIENSDLL